jgi:hypothetical protein
MLGSIKNPQIFSIDFTKPWWHLILKQKGICFLILAMASLMQIFILLMQGSVALDS